MKLYVTALLTIAVVASVAASAAAQSDRGLEQRALSDQLRGAITGRFPHAKVVSANLDTSRGVTFRLDMRDLLPWEIDSSVEVADTANIERLARAFIARLSDLLGIDQLTLEKIGSRYLPWGKRREGVEISFRQCFRGIPVIMSAVEFRIDKQELSFLSCHGVFRDPQVQTAPLISSDSAVAIIETSERNRWESGQFPLRVYGYGFSRILYDDYFDVHDSSQNWIPYSERVLGSQLVVFPDTTSAQVIPALAWRTGLGLGQRIDPRRLLYFEAYVDAANGKILGFHSRGGGCTEAEWEVRRCSAENK